MIKLNKYNEKHLRTFQLIVLKLKDHPLFSVHDPTNKTY